MGGGVKETEKESKNTETVAPVTDSLPCQHNTKSKKKEKKKQNQEEKKL